MELRQIRCDRCKNMSPITEIKYMPRGDSRIVLCKSCYVKSKQLKDKIERQNLAKPAKKRYICTKCRYKFSYDPKSEMALRCPYCSRTETVMEDDSPSADSLLRDTEE
jgi:transcription initiation factor IIE alpha subunit